ncbi:hypothetical protein K402DRAFT_463559 [Aulographum hederae CBS 113979]|uniref:Alcohol acetyltransferase n=1 Tax=Aulographum hederae CBS 113979 TaxID=1176131 RepID=A0A6G1H101_9PEZI|nr:hypothetical protein K402DRAFT_463559 [Aulographum hederae CBS 113979]
MVVHRRDQRFASPNEKRCIIREDLGFYNAVVVGAIYEFQHDAPDLKSKHTLGNLLRDCVARHPLLNAIVQDANTEKPYFEPAQKIDIENHIIVLDYPEQSVSANWDEMDAIEWALPAIHDRQFPPSTPPWRIEVLPLPDQSDTPPNKSFIAFSFSHGLGDGKTGIVFHQNLLSALQQGSSSSTQQSDDLFSLPPPFDTPQRLPISWSYLLGPLICHLFPPFLTRLLGLSPSSASPDAGTWTGSPIFYPPSTLTTKVKNFEIDSETMNRVLRLCRQNNAKFTGLLNHLLARSMGKCLLDSKYNRSSESTVTNLVAQTALNLRPAAGEKDDTMGLFATTASEKYFVPSSSASPAYENQRLWASAKSTTQALSLAAASLRDQPLGLLRYVSNMRSWMQNKIGQARVESFEVSNLGAFVVGSGLEKEKRGVEITKMVFSQPANVTGPPVNFSVVAVRGGACIVTVSWQGGGFGLEKGDGEGEREEDFVARICEDVEISLKELS